MAKMVDPSELLRSTPSETTPLLLALARGQAAKRSARDLVRQYASDRFVQPSVLDLRLAHKLDALALEAAHDFDALLLSPLAPLGTCSVVAPTSQDRTMTTTRGSEVVSDPTNVLALECARRLKANPHAHVRLCTQAGEHVPIADVGLFDWIEQLTNHAKLRLVASGAGIQLLPLLFRPVAS